MANIQVEEVAHNLPGKTCTFFVERKKRYCKMLVKEGNLHCGQHLIVDNQESNLRKRIPCPLDPKHSCFETRLKQHLTICNAREKTGLPYVNKNINLDSSEDEPNKTRLPDLSDAELLQFISRVETLHLEHVGEIKEEICHHTSLDEELKVPGYGHTVLRHLTQNASLLGLLQKEQLLQPQITTCYVEFGAGKGQLTQWLTDSVENLDLATFLLVDRSAQRYKRDAKLKCNEALKLKRLRVDIQHLDLTGVDEFVRLGQLVATGKHLCGGATDLALKCICQSCGPKMAGAVIALCCHHQCSWGTYIGKDTLQKLGFTRREFYTLLSLTSWAVCSAQDSQEHVGDEGKQKEHGNTVNSSENETTKDASPTAKVRKIEPKQDTKSVKREEINGDTKKESNIENEKENRYSRLKLSCSYREEIGRQAKQLLDYGRLNYMQSKGFNARLIQYVKRETTLENIAIIVLPNKQ